MKKRLPILLIAAGITVILAGFFYDVLFAGIPFQDPTPAMTARYEFHARIASIIRWAGLGMLVTGGTVTIARRAKRIPSGVTSAD